MKLNISAKDKNHPDPFIFEDGDRLYLYVTAISGVEAYSADDLFGEWKYEGIVTQFESGKSFWAPSVIKIDTKYYMYVSCEKDGNFQFMHVACADSPLGPFKNEKQLYGYFSIDSHMVKTEKGLFLFYAMDNLEGERIGTRVFVDKFSDPYTPHNSPKELIVPTFDEEIYQKNRFGDGKDWHTIEGPFWFCDGEWQYLMYSGGCYENDTYHVGYCAAKTTEKDLTKVDFEKKTDGGKFCPVLIKNEFEEGTGHHSVIKYKGSFYAIYHGRDYTKEVSDTYCEKRSARVCRLNVCDGVITAERFFDKIGE